MAMSDLTTSRCSSSTSPKNRRAVRRIPGLRFHPAFLLGLGLGLGLASPFLLIAPALAETPSCRALEARATLLEPRAGDIYLKPGAATCDRVEVDVAGRGLAGVFTASFRLVYPAALLKYDGYAAGSLLAQGTLRTAPFYLVRTPAPGVVVVTMTRFAPDGGAATGEGDGSFLTLRFSRVAAGSATIDFDGSSPAAAQRVLGPTGEAIMARFAPDHGVAVTIP